MSKEPNGVLVMTTCKCRENNQNLVMTRTYFQEMLATKVAWGAKQEQERIIKLLETMQETALATDTDEGTKTAWVLENAIALIKGENK